MIEPMRSDAKSVRVRSWPLFIMLLISHAVCAVEPGELAPEFTLPVLATNNQIDVAPPYQLIQLADYRGTALYLDFWDSSCTTCREALPRLNRIQGQFGAGEATVLSINLDRNPDDARRLLTRYPVNYTVASDPSQQLAALYGVRALPTAFFIARDGSIAGRHEGFSDQALDAVQMQLSAMVADPSAGEPPNLTLRGRE